MDFEERAFEDEDWIHLFEAKGQWVAPVKMIIHLSIQQNMGNVYTSQTIVSPQKTSIPNN